jgi:nitrous oxidase accessory protein
MIRGAGVIVCLLTLLAPCGFGALGAAGVARSVDVIADQIARALPGETIIIEPGRYEGRLFVRRPVVLDGLGLVTIDGLGEGNVIELLAPGITIRGLRVTGSNTNVTGEPAGIAASTGPVVIEDNIIERCLFGIDLRESPGSVVRRNTIGGLDLEPGRRGDGIRLWWSHNCVIEDNTVTSSRDLVFWYSEGLTIAGNRVSGSRYGLHLMYSHDTTMSDNELAGNSVGIYLMYSNRIRLVHNSISNNRGASGYGIGLKDCDAIEVVNNALLSNRVGIYVDNSPSSVDSTGLIGENMIAFNEIGFLATPNTHDNVLTANAFFENEEQASVHGRGRLALNEFTRDGVGNFWSDYAGFDRDGDGVGDLAYEPRSLFMSILAKQPNLRLFVHSPAQQAIEFTSRAFPELLPEPLLSDSAPFVRPPALDAPLGAGRADAWPMLGLAAALLGSALGLCWGVCGDGIPSRAAPARKHAALGHGA